MFWTVTNLITPPELFSPPLLTVQPNTKIWPFEVFQDGCRHHGRHLGFDPSGNSAIRSAQPQEPTRTKHEVDQMTRCRDIAKRNFARCVVGRRAVVNVNHRLNGSSSHYVNGDTSLIRERPHFDPLQNQNPWMDWNKIRHSWVSFLTSKKSAPNQIWWQSDYWECWE